MLDSPVSRHHKPAPQPSMDKHPPGEVVTYTMDVADYISRRYGTLRPPEKGSMVVVITDEQRRKALERRKASK